MYIIPFHSSIYCKKYGMFDIINDDISILQYRFTNIYCILFSQFVKCNRLWQYVHRKGVHTFYWKKKLPHIHSNIQFVMCGATLIIVKKIHAADKEREREGNVLFLLVFFYYLGLFFILCNECFEYWCIKSYVNKTYFNKKLKAHHVVVDSFYLMTIFIIFFFFIQVCTYFKN